jgi:ABC-type antimicrobial peptide transport system permease subunit
MNFYRTLLHDARELPGVSQAGLVSALPLRGQMWTDAVAFTEIPTREGNRSVANFRFTSPGYDDAIGLGMVGGRSLRESDWARNVVMISESLARRFPDRNIIGMHFEWHAPSSGELLSLEVIGVVRDFRAEAEKAPAATVYIPYWIWPPWGPTLVLRTAADPTGVAASVRNMIRQTHSEVPIARVETLQQVLDSAVASRRFLTRLGVVFAAYATFLAAVGLYGVVSLAAARRRREIAIRIAIGASHPAVFRMVISRALILTLASVAAGLLCGIGIERTIVSLLYDVHPAEPAVYAVACAIVMAVGLVASFVPAVRAARVDPAVALRYE